jgi:hypothetical protein
VNLRKLLELDVRKLPVDPWSYRAHGGVSWIEDHRAKRFGPFASDPGANTLVDHS